MTGNKYNLKNPARILQEAIKEMQSNRPGLLRSMNIMSSKALPISQEQDTKIKPVVSLAHTMLKNFFRIQVWLEELFRLSDERQSKPAELNRQVSSSSCLTKDQTLQKPRTQKPADER